MFVKWLFVVIFIIEKKKDLCGGKCLRKVMWETSIYRGRDGDTGGVILMAGRVLCPLSYRPGRRSGQRCSMRLCKDC